MRLYFSNFISSLYKNIEKMNGCLDELLFGLKKKSDQNDAENYSAVAILAELL